MQEKNYAMTTREVAEYLNISNQMVYNLISDGELPAFKIGSASRIMFSDLEKYIAEKKKEFISGRTDLSAFSVKNLSVKIDGFELKNISFSVPAGKILSILGASGSGKTVLLKAIAGLMKIDSGEILLGRTRLDETDLRDRKIGYVFEDYALFPHMTGRKNIEFPLKIRKTSKQKISEETEKRINELGINDEFLRTVPKNLPEGIKQLIAIARGKNHDFNLFILDEPMSHLDADQHVQMRMFLQKLVRDLHETTVAAFNAPEDALALSDYIAVIDDGEMLQFGETWEVYNNPVSPEVMEIVSSLGVNFIELEVRDHKTVPYGLAADAADGRYLMAFRPEEVEISSSGMNLEKQESQFISSSREIVSGTVNGIARATVMVPAGKSGIITFRPVKAVFFPLTNA